MTDDQYRVCERAEGLIPWTVEDWLAELSMEWLRAGSEIPKNPLFITAPSVSYVVANFESFELGH